MLDVLVRGIARAGGIEVADEARIFEAPPPRRSILRRLSEAFERWNVRRSTYQTLKQLDDRMLTDIGLHRGMLEVVAEQLGRPAAANDNVRPVALADFVANDNERPASKACV